MSEYMKMQQQLITIEKELKMKSTKQQFIQMIIRRERLIKGVDSAMKLVDFLSN